MEALHILLTGAGGGVGQMLRPYFAKAGVRVRLSDQTVLSDLLPNETFMLANLADAKATEAIAEGIDGIVHLGGYSVEGPWGTILQSNIEGCYNMYEAARVHGVARLIFASSNHAVGFYERAQTIGTDLKVRPDSRYGVSKVFGEALGALYSDKFGMRVTNLRIGNVGLAPLDRRRMAIWLHPEDLFQLIGIGLTHPDIRYETVYGMSDNATAWWDNRRATELGYRPLHRSEDFAAKIMAVTEVSDEITERYQGGTFCSLEHPGLAAAKAFKLG